MASVPASMASPVIAEPGSISGATTTWTAIAALLKPIIRIAAPMSFDMLCDLP